MRILYVGATGPADPTKASIPLHIAANGSVDAGRRASDEDLEWLGASWLTPPDFARMAAEYDRVVST